MFKKIKGFTLLEMIIALGIALTCVSMGGYWFLKRINKYDSFLDKSIIQKEIKNAFLQIEEDLKCVYTLNIDPKTIFEIKNNQVVFFADLPLCDNLYCNSKVLNIAYKVFNEKGTVPIIGLYRFIDDKQSDLILPYCNGIKINVYVLNNDKISHIDDTLYVSKLLYADVELSIDKTRLIDTKKYIVKKRIFINRILL